jgi:glycosyltransferase involved in cell wall biosynthesis
LKGIKKKAIFSLLQQVDTFVVLTEEAKVKVNKLFPGIPVEVLRNPVNIEAMKNRNGIQREKNRILYLGWYNREKGVYDLVDAVKILLLEGYPIALHFFGTKEIDQLRAYVENAGLKEAVSVHGWADDETKIAELHKATFLILPSYTEGIPNVIIEAMASKTPIISTLAGGLKEVLRDGENAIVIEPGNISDIRDKIAYGLRNPALRRTISENAYREAMEKYDIAHIKKHFESLMGLQN